MRISLTARCAKCGGSEKATCENCGFGGAWLMPVPISLLECQNCHMKRPALCDCLVPDFHAVEILVEYSVKVTMGTGGGSPSNFYFPHWKAALTFIDQWARGDDPGTVTIRTIPDKGIESWL